MNAAVLHGPRELRVQSRSALSPDRDEALVRVTAAGLCGTDYRIWTGDRQVTYPRIMGHEFVGIVMAVGSDVQGLSAGQRVAVEPNFSCGHCALCREGNRNLCLSRTAVGIDVDGGFAEQARVPSRCCWPAPAGLSDETLMLTEPLAVVTRAVGRGQPGVGETAAVVGVGTLGLLAVQVLKARGAKVLAVTRSNRRLALATELGADAVTIAEHGADVAAARALSGREGVDLVVETAGTAEAVAQAVELCRPGGRIVLTGLPHEATSLSFFWVVRRELRILGSMIYQDEFQDAMRLLATGAVRVDRLVTHRFPLAEIDRAFEAHRSPESIKVALTL
jgi:2-desacetyl-2-hydroxyethyl bacteriochlorophyllide A dehydrogenase